MISVKIEAYLDTDMIPDLYILNKLSTGYDNSCPFMATNKRQFGWQGPITIHSVKISMANTRVFNVDEDLVWAGLLYWDFLVDDG